MTSAALFTLILGAISVMADPVLKQVLTDNISSQPAISEELVNISEPEQNNPEENNGLVTDLHTDPGYETGQVNVVIEDDIGDPQTELLPPPQSELSTDYGFQVTDDSYRYAPVHKKQDEDLETAAGFVPITIFRRRQKPRRRFATRRNFMKNPYRKFHLFNPYYAYYYGPSSLGFY